MCHGQLNPKQKLFQLMFVLSSADVLLEVVHSFQC